MKSESKLLPQNSKAMILSLFSKFFQDHLLTEKEFNRDKKAYEKSYEIWQIFIKAFNDENKDNSQYQEIIKELTVQIQDILMNIKQENSITIPYLAEFNLLIAQTNEINLNQNQVNHHITQPTSEIKKQLNLGRQYSNPPKPSSIRGDSIEDKDYNSSSSKQIRSSKKNFTSILNGGKAKYIKEGNDSFHIKKHHSIFDMSNINKSIDNLNKQSNLNKSKNYVGINTNSYYGLNRSSQKICDSVDIVDLSQTFTYQSDIQELIDFLNSNNTKNFNETLNSLLKENTFVDNKTAYIFKSLNQTQEKMSLMDQFLFSISISHYQDLFQNSSSEKWQNVSNLLIEQKQQIIERERSDSDPENKMTLQQAELMKQIFTEFQDSVQQKKDSSIQLFNEFLQKANNNEQFSECLKKSLKESIISACKLNENNVFRKDIFTNWFIKNSQNNQIAIDQNKIKLLSYSLKKRIVIFKLSTNTNPLNISSSTTSLEVIQSFVPQQSQNQSSLPSICILWHNFQSTNNFYLILNENQKAYFSNKIQHKKQSKQFNPSIQIIEISLQSIVPDSYSRKSQSAVNSPYLNSSGKQKQSYDNNSEQGIYVSQLSATVSPFSLNPSSSQKAQSKSPQPKKDNFLLEKQPSHTSSSKKQSFSIERGFANESNQKLKEMASNLKYFMIENSFNINNLIAQIESNQTPAQNNQYKRYNIKSPTSIITHFPQSAKGFDKTLSPKKPYFLSPKPQPDYESVISLNLSPSSNNAYSLLGNQKLNIIQDFSSKKQNRGNEYLQPQIKILKGQNIRSSSQNQLLKPQDEQSFIKNQSKYQFNTSINTQNSQKTIPLPQNSRMRIQSGHVTSIGQQLDDAEQKQVGINLLLNTQFGSQRAIGSNFNTPISNEAQQPFQFKNEEFKKEELSDKKSVGYSNNGSPMIQLLNNPNTLNKYNTSTQSIFSLDKQEDSDKNAFKQIALTSTHSSIPQQNQISNGISMQGQYFSRKNNQQSDQGLKLVRSISTNPTKFPISPITTAIPDNDIKYYQDYQNINKLTSPNSLKSQQLTQRGVFAQQNIVIS